MLLGVHGPPVIGSPSETLWQLEILNANLTLFSLLFRNISKTEHFSLLANSCTAGAKIVAASLWADYHCHIPSSIIWYASHTTLWSGNSPEYKLIYTFNIMAFVSSATLAYITWSWNRSPARHCLPSSCKKNKKTEKRKRWFEFLHSWFCFHIFPSPWQSPCC